jgi:hypothetical protein
MDGFKIDGEFKELVPGKILPPFSITGEVHLTTPIVPQVLAVNLSPARP